MKKYFCMLLTAAMAGCTNDFPDTPAPEICPVEDDVASGLLIDSRSRTVDSSDAVKVATVFMEKESGNSRAQILALPETETVTDPETGKELLHVINWPGDGGFVIVSATKSAPPVLAFSETGRFSTGGSEATSELLEGLKMSVRTLSEMPEDSLLRINALNWALYEKPERSSVLSRSISMEMQEKMNKKIAKMAAAGWRHAGNITAARYRLPDSEYEALFRDATQWSNPSYNIEEVSLCFIKEEKLDVIGPLLTTHWHQKAPYNCVPVIRKPNIKKPVAGCAPIAIAQLCNYYRFPFKYKWGNLFGELYDNGIPINLYELMSDISDYCNVEYKEGQGSVAPGNDAVALQKLGFQNASYQTVSLSLMSSRIKGNKPFFMRGEGDDGHAWVCDGYQERSFPGIVSVVTSGRVIDMGYDRETGYLDISFNYYNKYESGLLPHYFHMNMGNGEKGDGGSDGWYHYFDNNFTGIKYPTNQRIVPVTLP